MSEELELKKKTPKYPQKIWLDVEDLTKILELSRELGVAPNVVCSKIIHTYLTNKNSPIEKITVKEKETIKMVVCPVCLKEFQDVNSIIEHIKESPSHIIKWLRSLSLT